MQRAVAAYAAELREPDGIELALRVGINSGEVIVGDIATADRFTYTAIGHTVGLAQRMEALAVPGSVYLTGHAARLAQGYLALRELGPHQVKGSTRPIPVFELVGLGTARGHIDVARGRGLTQFVGRDAELRELNDALAHAQVGDGQVVGVIADPGLGKSRLVSEFVQDIRKRGIEVHEAHCQAHARALPLVPVLEMMRSYLGITDNLDPQAARQRIETRLLQVDDRLTAELPLLFEFLAVPDPNRPLGSIDPEARRRRLLELSRRLVRAPSREQVVVNVIEDAHWIDPASDEFLANLVEATARSRTLVVVTVRPEYGAGWMRRSWYRQLPLSPLARRWWRACSVSYWGRIHRWTGWPSWSPSAPGATRSSWRRWCGSSPRLVCSPASRAATGWPLRSPRSRSPIRCSQCWPRGSIASAVGRRTCWARRRCSAASSTTT
jgi:hypothetical protein